MPSTVVGGDCSLNLIMSLLRVTNVSRHVLARHVRLSSQFFSFTMVLSTSFFLLLNPSFVCMAWS